MAAPNQAVPCVSASPSPALVCEPLRVGAQPRHLTLRASTGHAKFTGWTRERGVRGGARQPQRPSLRAGAGQRAFPNPRLKHPQGRQEPPCGWLTESAPRPLVASVSPEGGVRRAPPGPAAASAWADPRCSRFSVDLTLGLHDRTEARTAGCSTGVSPLPTRSPSALTHHPCRPTRSPCPVPSGAHACALPALPGKTCVSKILWTF